MPDGSEIDQAWRAAIAAKHMGLAAPPLRFDGLYYCPLQGCGKPLVEAADGSWVHAEPTTEVIVEG